MPPSEDTAALVAALADNAMGLSCGVAMRNRGQGETGGKLTEAPPPSLVPLCVRWGWQRVHEAWNRVHAYPVSWVTDLREVLMVSEELERSA
jgi:hypothetical protein